MNIENLYNNILIDARKPDIYTNYVNDDLNNKLLLFLILLSKEFNNMSSNDQNCQKFFDYIFARIETDLREVGYGDMSVNKKMKVIVTKFYSILVDFKNFNNISDKDKKVILQKYFTEIKKIDDFSIYINNYLSID
jgi:cytochrome b pre-mRNA-processing protein 3